jgi:hypothetical protein
MGPIGRKGRIILVLVAPTVLVVALVLILMQLHKPTRVELTLRVDRLAMSIAPDSADAPTATLIDSGRVHAARFDRAARVTFEPDTLAIADEDRFDLKANRFPEDAWRPIPPTGRVGLEPLPGAPPVGPAVTLQSAEATGRGQSAGTASLGIVKLVRAEGGAEVVMAIGREKDGEQAWMTVDLHGPAASVDLVFPARFLVFADYMGLEGAGARSVAGDTLSLRAASESNTLVHVQGGARGLVLQVEPAGPAATLLEASQIPVSAVALTRQGPTGERHSSLIGPGTLRYPSLPGKAPVKLMAGDHVSLDGLRKARIKSLGLDTGLGPTKDHVGLKLTLDAVASTVRVGTPEQPRDARLTWFDWLWHDPVVGIMLAIIVWVLPTTVAGYRLWKELRSPSTSS